MAELIRSSEIALVKKVLISILNMSDLEAAEVRFRTLVTPVGVNTAMRTSLKIDQNKIPYRDWGQGTFILFWRVINSTVGEAEMKLWICMTLKKMIVGSLGLC